MKFYLLLLLFIISNTSFSKGSYAVNQTGSVADSPKRDFVHIMQKRAKDEAIRSVGVYKAGKIVIHQRESIEFLKKLNQQVKIFLKEGIDTVGYNQLLKQTRESIDIVKQGIFVNKGTTQTERNLAVSAAILAEVYAKMEHQKVLLDKYSNTITDFRVKIDSLYSDSLLYSFSPDSLSVASFINRIRVVVKETAPVDTSLNRNLVNVQALQLKVDLMVFEIQSLKEDVDIYTNNLSGKLLNKEFPYLWEPIGLFRPFGDILRLSLVKDGMVMRYYLKENELKLFILLLVFCLVLYFINSLRQQMDHQEHQNGDFSGRLLINNPLLSAVFITLCIFQFIFLSAPFIFNFIGWLISAVCLGFIFREYITGYWMRFWIVAVILFLLAGVDNMTLQISRTERNVMALLSTIGIIYTGVILFNKHKRELKEQNIMYFITFAFACQIISLVLNMTGRVNLAKAFFVTGYSGLIIAIMFLWLARLINEGLMIASGVYEKPNRKLLFLNFNRVGSEVPPVFYVVLVIGWLSLIGRNFSALKKFYYAIVTFLTDARAVGNYKFSIMGLVVFFLILILSVFLSKLVSFFTADPTTSQEKGDNKNSVRLGSYILIIRISIICMGLFFAFAAAGIALDKITVIFGALGVGVGLGLQGLVNNLVSGLILSFERPVNVGDLIEINGKMATMKSIGFRSSIVNSSDGSCIVIPNGELLSQHLVNWTMGDNLKRNSFVVGVAYGTDLEHAKSLIKKLLADDDRIHHFPPAEVIIKDFNNSSIDFEVVFWPRHISLSRTVKSDLIVRISEVFKIQGIVIPFPQQDLNIRSIPEQIKPDQQGDSK
ncbi:MAG: mechanosensitive ion channel [Bacteroidota bacterium]|nr:mechanosensitive ion channel [Bacteroidota bacterium]